MHFAEEVIKNMATLLEASILNNKQHLRMGCFYNVSL